MSHYFSSIYSEHSNYILFKTPLSNTTMITHIVNSSFIYYFFFLEIMNHSLVCFQRKHFLFFYSDKNGKWSSYI